MKAANFKTFAGQGVFQSDGDPQLLTEESERFNSTVLSRAAGYGLVFAFALVVYDQVGRSKNRTVVTSPFILFTWAPSPYSHK